MNIVFFKKAAFRSEHVVMDYSAWQAGNYKKMRVFFKRLPRLGANLGTFGFWLFSLTSSALDHSVTVPPSNFFVITAKYLQIHHPASGCRTWVEHMTSDRMIMGSNPTLSWTFFLIPYLSSFHFNTFLHQESVLWILKFKQAWAHWIGQHKRNFHTIGYRLYSIELIRLPNIWSNK